MIAVTASIVCSGFSTIEIPISSFSVTLEGGAATYLQVVIPGLNYAEQIADRASGYLVIYRYDSQSSNPVINFPILPISLIRIDEGGKSQSITLQAMAS